VEVAPYKRNPMDFVLWKPSGDDLPGWDSPWGRGRPGWHIECSAMAHELLGESFDIHAGGIDLQFPHHENEIAQSACAHPQGEFARVWLHNEMLQVEGKKMSKSLGNFFTVRDLLGQGFLGETIRFVLLSTHYRKAMDWTHAFADASELKLMSWWAEISRNVDIQSLQNERVSAEIIEALANDLNTHAAFVHLNYTADSVGRSENLRQLAKDLEFLGLLNLTYAAAPRAFFIDGTSVATIEQQAKIETLIRYRIEAKGRRDFARADKIRSDLERAGVLLSDSPTGTVSKLTKKFDGTALEAIK
jgi:cysteinyl-tRNA synthetase